MLSKRNLVYQCPRSFLPFSTSPTWNPNQESLIQPSSPAWNTLVCNARLAQLLKPSHILLFVKNDLNVLISAMAGISDLQIGHYAYLLLSGGGSEFKEKKKKSFLKFLNFLGGGNNCMRIPTRRKNSSINSALHRNSLCKLHSKGYSQCPFLTYDFKECLSFLMTEFHCQWDAC